VPSFYFLNADLIGREKYDDYMNQFQKKIEQISDETTVENTFTDDQTKQKFNGPFTIAIDVNGSVYDDSNLPFQL
jgi:3-phenylpropionate/cinnamic acid dioxygenase small subunit